MAAKPFSKEQLNFFKFSALVFDEFPKVLRQIFVTMWDNKVSMKPGFIPWDDSTTVRNMLLTSEGGKTDIPTGKSIQEWDCTALFKATIYAKTFGVPARKGSTLNDLYLKKVKPAPGSFHSSVQSSTGNQDETYALAIDQLRLLRNSLCHSRKLEIVKTDFDVYVQLVTNALTAVNIDASFVDVIGQMSEDDFPTEKVQKLEEYRVRELQTISMFHENIEQKIDNVEQKLSSIEKTTEKIVNVDSKLSSIEERTDEIQTMVKKINLGEKRNVAETLPKPHIPSAVPLFTGREVEIKEITNLITDQSTRLLNIWGSPGFVSRPVISSPAVEDQMESGAVVTKDPSKQVTREDIRFIARDITTIWEQLGRALGHDDATLQIIDADYPNDAYKRCYLMLMKWTQIKVSQANYGALARAFKDPTVNRHDLSIKYC